LNPLRVLLAFLWIGATPAVSGDHSPFEPPQADRPTRIRILAYADYFDPQVLAEFENASGDQIAYDAYDTPDAVAAKLREGPYDIVIMPGPSLAREVAAGALQKFDSAKAPNALNVQSAVAAKLAAYDRSASHAIAYGWLSTGLLYDQDMVPKRLGATLQSWAVLFAPDQARRLFDCGIATPDSRDDLLVAAWRYLGVDPAKAGPSEIKRAVDVISHAKMGFRAFGAPDLVGALASGSACLAMGSQNAAQLAMARAAASGQKLDIRFALPREGAPMSLDAIAIPSDAPDAAKAYALADFLLRPDIALRNAKAAGVISSEATGNDETLKHLWPAGSLTPTLGLIVEKEWMRLRTIK
jgi:putrescine transport system substrate-binding protein